MLPITIKVQTEALEAALQRLVASVSDTTPAMRKIAGILKDASDRAFLGERDPATGTPWPALSPAYKSWRVKNRYDGPMLQLHGKLRSSINQQSGKNFARVGTMTEYAAIHQLGGEIRRAGGSIKLRFRRSNGRTVFAAKKHKRIVKSMTAGHGPYTIRMPARPYLGTGQSDIEDMLDVIARQLREAIA